MSRVYLGIAHTFHDSAVAVIDGSGNVVYAQATERGVQSKRALFMLPISQDTVRRALVGRLTPADELVVAFTWKLDILKDIIAGWHAQPDLTKIEPAMPASFLLGADLLRKLSYLQLRELLPRLRLAAPMVAPEVRLIDHHETHALAACNASPYDEAVCAVIDGMGDGDSTAFYHWRDGRLNRLDKSAMAPFPSGSLGFFYSALCEACGFDNLVGEEWKVMGLSAYGKFDRALYDVMRPMVQVDDLTLRSAYPMPEEFGKWMGLRMGIDASKGSIAFADLAHTGQKVFEEASCELLKNLHRRGLSKNLVLTGGCGLNSLWNGRILASTGFESLFVPCAPADDGNAVGAAWAAFQQDNPNWRAPGKTLTPYLGDGIDETTVERAITLGGLKPVDLGGKTSARRAAELLAAGKIVGWMQGRAEFGPRALGNRSILADARMPDVKEVLNARVKFREEFRPFAPAVLHEHGPACFLDYQESPYMERTLKLRPEMVSKVPGAAHEDSTGRLQSVKREWNERFYDLLSHFNELTGVPLILNTSFNVMGKPIIHSVEDAIAVYMTTGLDALVIGDRVFEKTNDNKGSTKR